MPRKTILALGADIKNRFLISNGEHFHFGPDIGNLSDAGNFAIFRKEIEKSIKRYRPRIIAHDLHPGYFSTKFARKYSHNNTQKAVQHHYAHIASVMQEYRLKKPVIGVSFDGTGLGTDGNIWGGEFLIVEKNDFKRKAHLKYEKMPGGDKVVSEPWRMALSILGKEAMPFLKSVKTKYKDIVFEMAKKDLNSPLTSSAGRLFDACAALLGICEYASYEAEGPIKLEAMCEKNIKDTYSFPTSKVNGVYVIDTKPLLSGAAWDLKKGKKKSLIASKFHNSVATIIQKTVKRLSKDYGIKDIALSGGVFQNRYLNKKVFEELSSKFNVFINMKTPVNDLNISLGQYYVSCSTCKN